VSGWPVPVDERGRRRRRGGFLVLCLCRSVLRFFLSRSFFRLLRLPRAHVDLFFASCFAPEVSIRSLRRREEKGVGSRRRRRRRRRRRKTEEHCGCAQRRLWQHLVMSTLEIEARE
jgi:hypothetical protein